MKISFEGRRAIVTGAGHGFGRAIARAFAENGASVWACDVNAEGLKQTREICGKACEVRTVDISRQDSVAAFVVEAAGKTAVDILVNNAGGVRGQVGRPIEEISPADWQDIFDVNVTGAFYCAQAVSPGMKKQKHGRIINISSGAGLGISLTGIQAYASAKAAQIGLTRQLAHELGPWGITVNNVAPGFVRSNPTTEKQWQSYGGEGQKRLVNSIALKHLGKPEDIAHAVMFFASDYAGWITGQVLSVDGGKEAMEPLVYVTEHRQAILEDLIAFASIPSVSTDPAYAAHIAEGAAFVAERMRQAGMENIKINPTEGHPVVTSDWLHAEGAPTILVYGHYDVQPPDPLEKWKSPPFKPEVRDNRLYARGVSDDKGPMLIPLKTAEAFLKTHGKLPINLKLVIEGEEERGSAHLGAFVKAHARELAADFVLSADGAMWRPDEPSITVANRGLAALEFTITGATKDLHSGRHGGSVANPLQAIAKLIATLHDDNGRVAVKGFYDGVRPPTNAARQMIADLPFSEQKYHEAIGAPTYRGEAGYNLLERQWLRPTLELNGLGGGYQGPGTKTVIPSVAQAKITCRLVPDQEPDAIVAAITRHLIDHCPKGVTLNVTPGDHGSKAYAIPDDHPGLALAERVLEEVYGKRSLRVRMGATIPIGLIFRESIGAETVFFSFSTSDEDYHAPNEFFRLQRLDDGLKAWIRYWELLGAERWTYGTQPAAGRPSRA